jgi:hypothetical protein
MDYQRELMLALITAIKPQPAPDIGALLTGMGSMLLAMKPNAVSDPAAMLQAMAATFQTLKPPEDNVEKALKVISMAKEIGGGGDREENFYTMLKDVGKTVVEKFAPNGIPTRLPTVGGITTAPAAVPLQIPAGDTPSTDTPEILMEKWLRAQLTFLKQKAAAGKDVAFWVDYIFENQEEPGNQALLSALDQGATFEHLLQFDAEIKQNPVLSAWFEKLYAKLRSELNQDVDSTGAGGNAPDPGSDPKPSA